MSWIIEPRSRLCFAPQKFFRECGGTDGSNPLPSSRESCELHFMFTGPREAWRTTPDRCTVARGVTRFSTLSCYALLQRCPVGRNHLRQSRRVGIVSAIYAPSAVNRFFWSIEQREVDRVAHLAVPAVAGVQPIAAIVDRPHLYRDLGGAKRSIENGDAIESAGLADRFVDCNAVLLARRVPRVGHEGLVTERGKRRANQL